MKEFTVAVTGGSGSACARKLLNELAAHSETSRIKVEENGATPARS